MTAMISLTDSGRWVRLTFAEPVLAVAVLEQLATRLEELAVRSPAPPIVIDSAHPTIFLAGAHLREIAGLDQRSCVDYATRGRGVIDRLRRHPAPTVAAVHGSCSGGGFDLVLGCDLIVADWSATFGHPGALRGLVTGWGGTVELPAALSRQRASAALLQGSNLTASELAERGLVTVVGDLLIEAAAAQAVALAALHGRRLARWRQLRSGRWSDRCWILPSPAIIDGASPPTGPNRGSRAGDSDRTGRRPGRPHDQDHPARR
jgi:enoyl-CoA hydratase/carnithine racemase